MQTTLKSQPWVPGQDGTASWDSVDLHTLISRIGAEREWPAVIVGGRTQTYGELADRSAALAGALASLGVESGDRVALSCRNRLEYLEIEVATDLANAVLTALSWRYSDQERIELLARSGAVVAIVDDDMATAVDRARADGVLPDLRHVVTFGAEYDELIAIAAPLPPVGERRHTDPHEIIFTSGTTGRPKGAVWARGTVIWNALQQALDFGVGPDSSTYVCLDQNYIGGRHQFVWAALARGGTVHIKESAGFDPAAVLAYVAEHRITHVLWVPTMLYDIVATGACETTDTSALQMIMCGGSPLGVDLINRARTAFPHTGVVQVFGLTEGGGTVTCVPQDRIADKIGSAGRPTAHNRIRIVDSRGVDCAVGEVGEVLVLGPTVTPGYWDDPETTAELFDHGWLRTGDLGYLDDESYLTISGRRKELIISGGMNIFPSEVEEALATLPGVRAVAVIGLPDDRWGETVCAVIEREADSTLTADDVIAHCRALLAGHKKPRTVHFVDQLPRTMSGKVLKQDLKARFTPRLGAASTT